MKQIVFLDTEILPSDKEWQKLTESEVLEFANEKSADGKRKFGIFVDTEKDFVELYNHEYIPTSDNWVAYVIGGERNQSDLLMIARKNIVNAIIGEIKKSGRCGCELDDLQISYTLRSNGCFPLMWLKSLRVNDKGELFGDVKYEDDEVQTIHHTDFTDCIITDCLMDIYDSVVYTISHRKERLAELREIVAKCGGEVNFDGNFTFTGDDASADMYECEETRLMGLRLVDGKLLIDDIWDGDEYVNSERFITDREIDRITEYVRNQCDCKFEVREEKNHLIVDVHGNAKPVFVAVNTIDYNGDYPTIQVCYGYDECEKIGWGKDITKQLNVGETKEEEVMYGKNATITRVA